MALLAASTLRLSREKPAVWATSARAVSKRPPSAQAAAAPAFADGDGYLWRLVADVAVAMVVCGKEPAIGDTGGLAVIGCDDAEVAVASPVAVVTQSFGVRERDLRGWELTCWVPRQRRVQRPADEFVVIGRQLM
jgi:hypothetical protein